MITPRLLCVGVLASLVVSLSSAQVETPRIGDPFFHSSGSWGQSYRDQWTFDAIGMSDPPAVWRQLGDTPAPVIVAMIDTGIDWNHLDLSWGDFWVNQGEIIGNGRDDDGNGYIDDKIGWDFLADTNAPWDYDGHGTFTSGLIAAETNNGIGITGLNPHARVMVLKAVNNFGRTRAAHIAEAIRYAADNNANIINLSLGGETISALETDALDYAAAKGLLIIVAAGNEGKSLDTYGLVNHPAVIVVAATDRTGQRAEYSNWGPQISIAAPGEEILSLRARATDTLITVADTYQRGSAIVGPDRRYYRATGTSFAAPLVTGAATLIWSQNPSLSADQVRQMLLQSASDIGTPGIDQFTGYGALDVNAALQADPAAFVQAAITDVTAVQNDGRPAAAVVGTASSDRFDHFTVELGAGEAPKDWRTISTGQSAIIDGVLGTIPASAFSESPVWMIRLTVTRAGGQSRTTLYRLQLG